jgi:hypothetical protein
VGAGPVRVMESGSGSGERISKLPKHGIPCVAVRIKHSIFPGSTLVERELTWWRVRRKRKRASVVVRE